MKKLIIPFVLLAAVLMFYPYLDDSDTHAPLTGLPWQIELLPDGATRVFGLTLSRSSLANALAVLGQDMELALVAAADEVGNLEMYYGNYRAGLLSGKLVLQTSSSEDNLRRWRDNAVRFEHMASGQAKKYLLAEDDLPQVLQEVITGITFIPAVNLNDEIIVARFGEPVERVQIDSAIHYLYPAKGIDIAVFDEAKEVIQYVAPSEFKFIKIGSK
ncbi:MAG: hypothetical protein OEZ15_09495 [Gammaproteobacteria bacterium]|nr:hypothetical protein [Gammaproteobacteria bacterium]